MIQPIADEVESQDQTVATLDEAVGATAAGTFTVSNVPVLTIQAISNLTGTVLVDLAAADFNYTALDLRNGEFQLNTSTAADNFFINYTYLPSSYVEDATSRTILNATLVLFFAVGILLFVIGWFNRSGIREMFDR